MNSFADIIDAFGGPARFGEAVAVSASHAGVMKWRNAIPAEYWPAVVAAAAARQIVGVSYEVLAEIAASRRRRAPGESQMAEAG